MLAEETIKTTSSPFRAEVDPPRPRMRTNTNRFDTDVGSAIVSVISIFEPTSSLMGKYVLATTSRERFA